LSDQETDTSSGLGFMKKERTKKGGQFISIFLYNKKSNIKVSGGKK
jgi:hypothetical protein